MARRPIAVLGGTGQQGRGLAQRLARAGYPIVIGSRDPQRAAALVHSWEPTPGSIQTASYGDAIAATEVSILTVPFEAAAPILAENGTRFPPGSLLVDVTVPLTFETGKVQLLEVPEGSAAEHVKAHVPEHVRVAAAFKTLPAHIVDLTDAALDCDEFVCGDSAEARAGAVALVQAVQGLRAIDVGPLARARSIEHLTLLAVGINRRHKIRDARFRIVGL